MQFNGAIGFRMETVKGLGPYGVVLCADLEDDAPENIRYMYTTCPDYFRWIHEDLRPLARTGITQDMVERAKQTANFRFFFYMCVVEDVTEKNRDPFNSRTIKSHLLNP